MPIQIAIRGVQLPGREQRHREQPYRELPTLVNRLTEILLQEADRPFVLFGHSFGAVIATLLAQQLEQELAMEYLKGLIVSGIRPPHLPREYEPISHLEDEEFLVALHKRYRSIPPILLSNRELRSLYLPALRLDFTMLETRPEIGPLSLNCPVVAFGGTEDAPQTTHLREWSVYTNTTFRSHVVAGDHFFPRTNADSFLPMLRSELCELLAINGDEASFLADR